MADLTSSSPEARRTAAWRLGETGSGDTGRIGPLLATLRDRDTTVGATAAWSLGRIGPEAVPGLVRALGDTSAWVRRLAAYALGEVGSLAEEATPALRQLERDPDPRAAQMAAWALGRVGGDLPPGDASAGGGLLESYMRRVAERLRHPRDSVRLESIMVLRSFGPAALPILPSVVRALGDENPAVRTAAEEIIASFGERGTGILQAALLDEDPAVRDAALQGMVRLRRQSF